MPCKATLLDNPVPLPDPSWKNSCLKQHYDNRYRQVLEKGNTDWASADKRIVHFNGRQKWLTGFIG
jgi:hypothetical protein